MQKIKQLSFDNLSLIFYDITSCYFEGRSCPLGEFGLFRDHKKDKLQLLLALVVTQEGFPFYWQVLPTTVHDCLTVKEVISAFKEENINFLEENNFFYKVTIGKHKIRKLEDFPLKLVKELQGKIEKKKKI